MREQFDVVEDVRIKKGNSNFSKYIVKVMITFLVFIFFCIMSFSTIYFLVIEKINNSSNGTVVDNNSTRKAFNVEMKLRKDLEKMTQKKTQ